MRESFNLHMENGCFLSKPWQNCFFKRKIELKPLHSFMWHLEIIKKRMYFLSNVSSWKLKSQWKMHLPFWWNFEVNWKILHVVKCVYLPCKVDGESDPFHIKQMFDVLSQRPRYIWRKHEKSWVSAFHCKQKKKCNGKNVEFLAKGFDITINFNGCLTSAF